jgi:Mannitol repressor
MSAWLKALKALVAKLPTEEELELVTKESIHSESDRAMALMNSSLVESALQVFIRNNLVPMGAEERESLFERDGPLSSFSKLIRVSFAFGVIDEEMKRNFNIVRELRNAFAHSRTFVTFETPAIANACAQLSPWFTHFEDTPHDKDHPRTKYLGTSTRLSVVIGTANIRRARGESITFPLRFRP